MVRRAALLPLLVLLSLAGCSFFTASLFPGYLAQVEKSHDLGSRIDAFLGSLGSMDFPWHPSVFVLTSATGADYGGLLIEIDSRPEKMLFMADSAGGLQELTSVYFSQLHFTNSDVSFVVGRLFFPPGNLGAAMDSQIPADGRAFSAAGGNFRLWTTGTESNLLYWQTLGSGSPPWSTGTSNSLLIDPFQYSFELRGVFYDPQVAVNPLALIFFNYGINRVFLFRTPAPPSVVTSFNADYPPLTFGDVDAGKVSYTHKGVVVAQDREATLMDFSGNETGKRLNLGQGWDKSLAFDIEGDVFYLFDPGSRRLYRGNTGW